MLSTLPEIPAWPQLPKSNFLESMYIQFSGGMPFVELDLEKGRMHMNLSGDIYGELEKFYTRVIDEDLDYFSIHADYARGLEAFKDRMWRQKPETVKWVKGQITGPISFGLMITDHRKRAVLYHEEVFDSVLKTLVLKSRWQVRLLKKLCDQVIIFIDEPYLSSFGSAFINVTREQVVSYLGEVIEAVHNEGALAGVHCCGNTDWSILMETDIDIINFDAFEYFQGMTLYIDQLKDFLDRKGILAWGIVPTSERIESESVQSLTTNFMGKIDDLANRGISRNTLLKQALVTPSCGMGTMKYQQATLVLGLLANVSRALREETARKKKRKKAV
ncbi:methionine synthase [candidate division LCP-89 bacterium B3_LCP]|uniref:Methionine synthase n=1 Tax=candidate division LCP-89 bacterium B3_LCP TaxID=2012998 RepID=A0A532UPJ6_UNCL8|nr:MAG: methionine synthase [candidate division LCP-89 bacterium B3_LCP]